MGEAKRRRASQGPPKDPTIRTWATGKIRVEANDVHCFDWIGTKQEAIDVQKEFLEVVNTLGISADSYAKRAAGYLIAFGMPAVGDKDQRPSNLGSRWEAFDIVMYRAAVLWTAMRENIPNTGKKVEDVFVGESLMVVFTGDADQILDETSRELSGKPFSGEEFKMTIAGVGSHDLNPNDAITMTMADFLGAPLPDAPDELIYVPRIPCDEAEKRAMRQMIVIFVDTVRPGAPCTYAGYTDDEMRRGKPGLRIDRE